MKVLRQSIDKGEQRIRQIDKAIEELFEANICGKITDERFIKMTARYEKEQKNLTASVENWKLELENAQQQEVDLRQLLWALREFTEVKQLTPELVNTLIQRIEVHRKEKVNGRNRDESRYGGNPAQPQSGNHHIKTAAAQSTNVKLRHCLYNTSLWVPS